MYAMHAYSYVVHMHMVCIFTVLYICKCVLKSNQRVYIKIYMIQGKIVNEYECLLLGDPNT